MKGRSLTMNNVYLVYLDGKLYGWTCDKDKLSQFKRQRNQTLFKFKKRKIDDISILDKSKEFVILLLSIESDAIQPMIVTNDENLLYEETYNKIKDFFISMNRIYTHGILNDKYTKLLYNITEVFKDDLIIVDNIFIIDEIRLFSSLFKSTL